MKQHSRTLVAARHARTMDDVYRYQRFIYDLTRKYYLFGRDTLLATLDIPDGGRVLEIGCGTGRNLVVAARANPRALFYGVDISAQMLKTASAKAASAFKTLSARSSRSVPPRRNVILSRSSRADERARQISLPASTSTRGSQ